MPVVSLRDAIAEHVHDGATVALEGFTHLIPHAAGQEIVRQKRRALTLIRMTPDIVYDQMIGMGCAAKLVFSWGGNPGVGSLHRLRDAIERDWPSPLVIEEHSHAGMAAAYVAGASRLPFGVLRGYTGTDLPAHNSARIAFINCPFTGQQLAAVHAVTPDVAIIHAQQADASGNVRLWGLLGVQKEAVLASRAAIVTVEEIVNSFDNPSVRGPRGREPEVVLPAWTVASICHVPGGAHPAYAAGYSTRDNAFYKDWDDISRDRSRFLAWMQQNVLDA